jgi:hypothetical protein
MAEREHERRDHRAQLLVGPGPRAREAGAVLAVLSSLDTAGERRLTPLADTAVADLEELLAQRAVEGLLILEAGRVPLEDIGFVRRFLERHAGWRLAVAGEDANDPRARALLSLARAQWLAWPPDLERLRALLPAGGAGGETPRARRAAPRAVPAPAGGVDLGELLEELLAGAALRGDGAARYHLSPRHGFRVARERGALSEGLRGLIELARVCAGADGLVRATLDGGNGDAARVQLDFPRSGLPEEDVAALLDGPPGAAQSGPLAQGLAAARQGALVLREAGGEVELAGGAAGRVQCAVRFPARTAPLEAARSGKPEDPFA